MSTIDPNQIQITLDAINKTQVEFNRVLQDMSRIERATQTSIAVQQRANAAINAGVAGYRNLAFGITAAATAAAAFGTHLASNVTSLAREARSLETTTERLSALRFALEQGGVSANESSLALSRLGRAISEGVADPASKSAAAIKALNIPLDQLQNRDRIDVVLQIADAFEKHSGAAAKAYIAQILFEEHGRKLIDVLNGGSSAILRNMELAGRLGATVKSQTANEVENLNARVAVLKTSFEGLALTLLDKVAPALTSVADDLQKILSGQSTGTVLSRIIDFKKRELEQEAIIIGEFFKGLHGQKVNVQAIDNAIRTIVGQSQNDDFISTDSPPDFGGRRRAESKSPFLSTDLPPEFGGRRSTQATPFKTPLQNPEEQAAIKKRLELQEQLNLAIVQKRAELTGRLEDLADAEFKEEEILTRKNQDEIANLALTSAADRNALLRVEEERHQTAISAITEKALHDREQAEKKSQEEKKRIRDLELSGTEEMFGNLMAISKTFGHQAVDFYKGFAAAQAVVSGIRSTIAAIAWGTEIGSPILGAIAGGIAAAAAAAQVATIAAVNPSFAEGGFTGAGIFDGTFGKHSVAGVVHAGEVVIPQKTVRKFGLEHFAEYFGGRMPGYSGARGFADGGFAGFSGSFGTPTITGSSARPNFHFTVVNSRNDEREAQSKAQALYTLDFLRRRGNQVR